MQTPGTVASGYAMGWGPIDVAGRTLLVHSGNLFTYTAVQAIDPGTREGWAVLTNSAALADPAYETLLALVGKTEVPRSERVIVEAGLAVAAIVFGAVGDPRRATRATSSRLAPALVPAVDGRTVTWAQMTYFPASLPITLAVVALAGLVTFLTRLRSAWSVARSGHAGPAPHLR